MLYDVFICHASEDKDKFVRPLANKLQQYHLEVWFDEFSLSIGDSLRESIDKGLSKSRFGVVVLSRNFFKKKWPTNELNGLFARETSGENQVILPIWHGVNAKEIIKHSPLLADRKAVVSAKGLDFVCKELLKKLRPDTSPLIIARDILIKYGLNPPVISDEWWLDVIEASNRVPNGGFVVPDRSCWGRWTFPLPNFDSCGKDRGDWLAWSAMQMQWEKEAERRKIAQITKPEIVLKFIDTMPGLKDACHSYPLFLANYAPQLTIKGFSGDFDPDFDYMLKQSTLIHEKERKSKSQSGTALTTNSMPPACDIEIALRHPAFGDFESSYIACQFVQGEIGGPEIRHYEHFEYLVWFLSSGSDWLPKKIKYFLIDGMKKWAVWLSPGKSYDWDKVKDFSITLMDAKSLRSFKLTTKAKAALLNWISHSLKVLGVSDKPRSIMNRFLDSSFIECYIEENRIRSKKKRAS
ncbi:MAG: TIR domain-containing protein [Candidatus Omnitrophota bacterium]|jgi:hypothetical protein